MTLLRLSWQSIGRKPANHLIYAVSLALTAFISNTYWSIQSNPSINRVIQSKASFASALSAGGIIISLFLLVLVLYTNRFYMTVREKEFGLYLLFGESNQAIAKLLLGEQLFFVFAAGVLGNLFGTLFSKLFGTILVRMMGFENQVAINLSFKPVLISFALLLLVALLVTAVNLRRFNRLSLVSLFTGHSDLPRVRKVHPVLAFAGIVLIICAMLYSTQTKLDNTLFYLFMAFTLGIILFINQTLNWYVKKRTASRGYLKNPDMITTAALRNQLPRNTFQLTLITLLSSVTLFLVIFSILNLETQRVVPRNHLPEDFLYAYVDEQTNQQVERIFAKTIRQETVIEGIPLIAKTAVATVFSNPKEFGKTGYVMSRTLYNQLRTFRGERPLTLQLKGTEAVSFSRGAPTVSLDEAFDILIGETGFNLRVKKRLDSTMIGWRSDLTAIDGPKAVTFVVSDEYYRKMSAVAPVQKFAAFQLKQPTKRLQEVTKAVKLLPAGIYYSAFVIPYSVNIQSGALLLFIATFFAVISFMALGATIYFKQLQEAYDDRRRYQLLQDLGVDETILRRNIRKQLGILFIVPCFLGTLEAVALTVPLLKEIHSIDTSGFTWGIIGCFILIYLLFYISSVQLYQKIALKPN